MSKTQYLYLNNFMCCVVYVFVLPYQFLYTRHTSYFNVHKCDFFKFIYLFVYIATADQQPQYNIVTTIYLKKKLKLLLKSLNAWYFLELSETTKLRAVLEFSKDSIFYCCKGFFRVLYTTCRSDIHYHQSVLESHTYYIDMIAKFVQKKNAEALSYEVNDVISDH